MTMQSESVPHSIMTLYSTLSPTSQTSMLFGSKLALEHPTMQKGRTEAQEVQQRSEMLAEGIMRGAAPTCQPLVPMHMSVLNAEATDMSLPTVTRTDASVDHWAHCPHYARDLVWDEALMHHMTLMQFTEIAHPLLSPPDDKLNNQVVLGTIAHNPHLFKLVTPINVNLFESFLTTHPNWPFVSPVCCGF